MTEPALAPRSASTGVVVVWAVAFVAAVAVGIFVAEEWRIPWMLVAFGGTVLLAFAVQLGYGRTDGFILRVGSSVLGSLLLMGMISVGFGLAALIPA
jgi:hypothetical protein